MHVGDTFPNRDLPIMDKNNGGSGVEFSATLAKAAAVPGVKTIINGHIPTTMTPADVKTYSAFIGEFVAAVQAAKKAGKTVDDVVATWATPASLHRLQQAAAGAGQGQRRGDLGRDEVTPRRRRPVRLGLAAALWTVGRRRRRGAGAANPAATREHQGAEWLGRRAGP